MGCSCSSSSIPEKTINSFQSTIQNRGETIIVDWSKAIYGGGGAYGDIKFEGVVALTNNFEKHGDIPGRLRFYKKDPEPVREEVY